MQQGRVHKVCSKWRSVQKAWGEGQKVLGKISAARKGAQITNQALNGEVCMRNRTNSIVPDGALIWCH